MLRIGSLFSGSGGFELSATLCGIEPTWASEIEPFPIRVTTKRFPNVRHIGDVSKVNGADIEPVDVITFGSPCQDLSVAGQRAGMKHTENGDEETTRSGLFMEAVRIIKEMREETDGKYPTFAVWENVPGAYSSNKGEDFRTVLEELAKVKETGVSIPKSAKWLLAGEIVGEGYSIAWRTLDAQYWGVPQRRRRIYLVADFRGQRAGEILFEREGLRGYITQSGTQGQGTAGNVESCVGAADSETILTAELGIASRDGGHVYENIAGTLRANAGDNQLAVVMEEKPVICMTTQQGGAEIAENLCPTITAAAGMSGNNQPVICLQGNGIDRADTAGCNGKGWKEDISYTLNTVDRPAVCYSIDRAAFNQGINTQYDIGIDDSGVAHTLVARGPNAVCYAMQAIGEYKESDHASTLKERDYKDATDIVVEERKIATFYPQMKAESQCFSESGISNTLVNGTNPGYQNGIVEQTFKEAEPYYIVRRLTPLECCRLQGFPDWWTAGLETEEPTEEDLKFWREVFETHRQIVTGATKPKTDKQIIKWLKDPYSDSAAYKMWGNGIALPNALFVMEGIAEKLQQQEADEMAMTCIDGARECEGCMACQERQEVSLYCPMCGHELDCDDMVYRLRKDDEVVGCEHCAESVFAENAKGSL